MNQIDFCTSKKLLNETKSTMFSVEPKMCVDVIQLHLGNVLTSICVVNAPLKLTICASNLNHPMSYRLIECYSPRDTAMWPGYQLNKLFNFFTILHAFAFRYLRLDKLELVWDSPNRTICSCRYKSNAEIPYLKLHIWNFKDELKGNLYENLPHS